MNGGEYSRGLIVSPHLATEKGVGAAVRATRVDGGNPGENVKRTPESGGEGFERSHSIVAELDFEQQ